MSLEANTSIKERAYELAEELTSHPAGIDRGILQALESGDMEEIAYWVAVGEQTLSQHYFYERNLMEREASDVA